MKYSGNITADNDVRVEWKPSWTKEDFYAHTDDEIDAVLELGQAKSSLIEFLRGARPAK